MAYHKLDLSVGSALGDSGVFAKNLAERVQTANTVTIGRKGIELKGLIYAVSADVQVIKVEFRRYIIAISD